MKLSKLLVLMSSILFGLQPLVATPTTSAETAHNTNSSWTKDQVYQQAFNFGLPELTVQPTNLVKYFFDNPHEKTQKIDGKIKQLQKQLRFSIASQNNEQAQAIHKEILKQKAKKETAQYQPSPTVTWAKQLNNYRKVIQHGASQVYNKPSSLFSTDALRVATVTGMRCAMALGSIWLTNKIIPKTSANRWKTLLGCAALNTCYDSYQQSQKTGDSLKKCLVNNGGLSALNIFSIRYLLPTMFAQQNTVGVFAQTAQKIIQNVPVVNEYIANNSSKLKVCTENCPLQKKKVEEHNKSAQREGTWYNAANWLTGKAYQAWSYFG